MFQAHLSYNRNDKLSCVFCCSSETLDMNGHNNVLKFDPLCKRSPMNVHFELLNFQLLQLYMLCMYILCIMSCFEYRTHLN